MGEYGHSKYQPLSPSKHPNHISHRDRSWILARMYLVNQSSHLYICILKGSQKTTSMHVKEYNIEIQVQVKVLLLRKKFCLNWKIERTIMKKMLDKFIYGFSMQYIEATVPDCRWKLNVILLCKDNIVANFLQIVFAKPAKEKRKHPAFLQFKFAIIDFLKCSQTVWLKRSDPVGNQIIFHTEFWSFRT